MNVSYAILGFLLAGPRSGYDLKKLFAESESLHWSGNSNQIYGALVELHRQGLATKQVEQPEQGPSRKVYSITKNGRAVLKAWLRSEPELPQLRIPIFTRLMSADLLSQDELDDLLRHYEEALQIKVLSLEELRRRRGPSVSGRRQAYLWERINERSAAIYRAEEEWVRVTRRTLATLEDARENDDADDKLPV